MHDLVTSRLIATWRIPDSWGCPCLRPISFAIPPQRLARSAAGVGQELQSAEGKFKEAGERIEDISTVKERKDHE
jgi:hypothetical protein